MHELTWVSENGSRSWRVRDGICELPSDVMGPLGAKALLAAGRYAMLLSDDRVVSLQPGRPHPPPGAARGSPEAGLVWHPGGRRRPAALCAETTRDEAAPGEGHELRLVRPDGEVVALGDEPVIIGRHRLCHVRFKDSRISALHCLLQRLAEGVRVLDLESTNGTFVDGARVREIIVQRRAAIEVGGSRLMLLSDTEASGRILLPSEPMRRLEQTLERIAGCDAPVLIQGESGSGKDGVAERIHALSGRPGPFVPLNAAAISPTLSASELFGHVRGSFTGADRDRDGAFVSADRGTLFLDEIAELPLATQSELLRAVEQRRVRRLGDHKELPVDVRLVTATNRDLAAEVRAGRFREDLYHRICVVLVTVPPLRERLEDVEALASHYLSRETPPRQLSPAALARLKRHSWPGNARELINVLRRACVFTDHEVLEAGDLETGPSLSAAGRLDDLIHDTVIELFNSSGGDVAETARQLGIHRATVYRHLKARRRGQDKGAK